MLYISVCLPFAGCDWSNGNFFTSKDTSQLITWQDGRCSSHFLSSLPKPDSHLCVVTGFGCATIFWYMRHRSASPRSGPTVPLGLRHKGEPSWCVVSRQAWVPWGIWSRRYHPGLCGVHAVWFERVCDDTSECSQLGLFQHFLQPVERRHVC